MRKLWTKVLALTLCLGVVGGGLAACSPKETADSQDNLFASILQEGTLLPSGMEFLSPMERRCWRTMAGLKISWRTQSREKARCSTERWR